MTTDHAHHGYASETSPSDLSVHLRRGRLLHAEAVHAVFSRLFRLLTGTAGASRAAPCARRPASC